MKVFRVFNSKMNNFIIRFHRKRNFPLKKSDHIFSIQLISPLLVIRANSNSSDYRHFEYMRIFFLNRLFCHLDEFFSESHMLSASIGFFTDSESITENMNLSDNRSTLKSFDKVFLSREIL